MHQITRTKGLGPVKSSSFSCFQSYMPVLPTHFTVVCSLQWLRCHSLFSKPFQNLVTLALSRLFSTWLLLINCSG